MNDQTKRTRLDKIDRKILSALQEEGRITNVELARRAGISAPPCLRRVRTLEESGFIRSYHAVLDNAKLGFTVTAFAQVSMQNHHENDLKKFEAKVQEWPYVRECFMISGETDFLLKIVAPDWEAYQNFLTSELASAENVASVRTSLAMRASKMEPGVPINDNN